MKRILARVGIFLGCAPSAWAARRGAAETLLAVAALTDGEAARQLQEALVAIVVIGLLLAVAIAIGLRSWILERTLRMQVATLAYVERRRRRILEDINGTRPVGDLVVQITELVSFRLHGAPCWCQLADGKPLGNQPRDIAGLRMAQEEILGRSGAALGKIVVGFDQRAKKNEDEAEALLMGAGLARLTIETRRLYTDLVRRSEFDLLTDVENRFSLEKHLDELFERANRRPGCFGLIYIDLNDFKMVNDVYGHHVGDIYLQEAARRMKRQLRPGDTLARLGGDEFAVLVPAVESRTDVQEIALRLGRCFDDPFTAQRFVLQGSASLGIALYPEDAQTRDALLRAADAAMYAEKTAAKMIAKMRPTLTGTQLIEEISK